MFYRHGKKYLVLYLLTIRCNGSNSNIGIVFLNHSPVRNGARFTRAKHAYMWHLTRVRFTCFIRTFGKCKVRVIHVALALIYTKFTRI
jgi:hypothetical protein